MIKFYILVLRDFKQIKFDLLFFFFFFYSLLFRDASTSLVIPRLGSLGVYQKAVYFYCCVVNVSFVKFTDLIL